MEKRRIRDEEVEEAENPDYVTTVADVEAD